nr:EOG090X03LH [Lepidurus arcticus]
MSHPRDIVTDNIPTPKSQSSFPKDSAIQSKKFATSDGKPLGTSTSPKLPANRFSQDLPAKSFSQNTLLVSSASNAIRNNGWLAREPKSPKVKKMGEFFNNLIDFGSPPSTPTKKKNNVDHLPKVPVGDLEDVISSRSSPAPSLNGLEIGSLVEVAYNAVPQYGVVKWLGRLPSQSIFTAGVELEDEVLTATDGYYKGKRYFVCPPGRGVMVNAEQCTKDSRFLLAVESPRVHLSDKSEMDFGSVECVSVPGRVPPLGQLGSDTDDSRIYGKYRGIQGHHNSCYLDATLFSMFSFTSVFDSLLFRPQLSDDIPQYGEVQRVLKEEIVNPLRNQLYVRADRVMKLRTLLQKLSSVQGLTSEEKDPEEFLHCLLSQTLKAEPLLRLSSGQDCFHHQLFIEKDESLLVPCVQQLFEQSFLASSIKLRDIPPCLIIQMPRFGKAYKMYEHVLPSLILDITDVLEDSPRQCIVCGKMAEVECPQCWGQCGNGLESISFCQACLNTVHSHRKRTNHTPKLLSVPVEFTALQAHCAIPRVYMELFAVVCIATSHYVCFAKCGSGPDAPWCFFDSMADRKGEQHGYNIPEVTPCPDLAKWLSEEWDKTLLFSHGDKAGPDYVRRVFSDAYMCLYQSPDVMMYR